MRVGRTCTGIAGAAPIGSFDRSGYQVDEDVPEPDEDVPESRSPETAPPSTALTEPIEPTDPLLDETPLGLYPIDPSLPKFPVSGGVPVDPGRGPGNWPLVKPTPNGQCQTIIWGAGVMTEFGGPRAGYTAQTASSMAA